MSFVNVGFDYDQADMGLCYTERSRSVSNHPECR